MNAPFPNKWQVVMGAMVCLAAPVGSLAADGAPRAEPLREIATELDPPSCNKRTRDVVPLAPPMVRLPATAAVPDVILTSVPLVEKTLSELVGTVPRLQFVAVAHDVAVAPVKLLVWA